MADIPQTPAALTAHRRDAIQKRMAHTGGGGVRQGTEASKQDADRVQLTGQPPTAETVRAAEDRAAHLGLTKEKEEPGKTAPETQPKADAPHPGVTEGANGTLMEQDSSTIAASALQARHESDQAWAAMQQAFGGLSEAEKGEAGKQMAAAMSQAIPDYDKLSDQEKQQKLQELKNTEDGWMLQALGASQWAGQRAEAAAAGKNPGDLQGARRIAQLFYGASNYVKKRQEFLLGVNELHRRGEDDMVQNVLTAPAPAQPQPRPGSSAEQPTPPGPTPPTSGNEAELKAAQAAQMAAKDRDEVQKIFMQMAADRQRAMAEMFKIIHDMYTDIWATMRAAWLYRAQAGAKANSEWNKYLNGAAWS